MIIPELSMLIYCLALFSGSFILFRGGKNKGNTCREKVAYNKKIARENLYFPQHQETRATFCGSTKDIIQYLEYFQINRVLFFREVIYKGTNVNKICFIIHQPSEPHSLRQKTKLYSVNANSYYNLFIIKEESKMPRVTFKLDYPQAESVFIAGSFNDWDTQAYPLRRTKKGHWSITLTLPCGRYEYRYIVDGEWYTDPSTPRVINEYGSENSVIEVKSTKAET